MSEITYASDTEMTYEQAALFLGVSERRVRELAAIHGWKAGRHWIDGRKVLLYRDKVERFARERPVPYQYPVDVRE